MNKLGLFFVLGLMLAVFAGSANAVLTLSSPTMGGTSQYRGLNASATLTLTNNETTAVTAVLTFAPVGTDSATERAYTNTISFSNTTVTVPANSTPVTVTITGLVPADFDGVNADFDATAFKIGTITASYASTTATAALNMQAQNGLEFDYVKIMLADAIEDTVKDGETVDELKPNDRLSIEVSAESKFKDSHWDYDVESVNAAILVDNSDFDIDENEDLSDLSPGDTDSATFSNLVVDPKASGTYNLVITLSGTDENGAVHGETMTVKLKVERETHELIITKAQLTKPTVKCTDGEFEKTDAKVSVLNIGKKDEEDAAVEAVISDLDLTVSKDSINIDKDDAGTYTITLQVPEGTKAGTYDVDVIAYAVADSETARRTLSLTVESCAAEATATTATATTATTTGTATTATTGTAATATAPAARITSTGNVPFTETNTYMYVLGGVVVVLLVSTIWIGLKLAALAK